MNEPICEFCKEKFDILDEPKQQLSGEYGLIHYWHSRCFAKIIMDSGTVIQAHKAAKEVANAIISEHSTGYGPNSFYTLFKDKVIIQEIHDTDWLEERKEKRYTHDGTLIQEYYRAEDVEKHQLWYEDELKKSRDETIEESKINRSL